MMNKTKIEWCEFTYNPITGCLHGCPYCYARRQAQRFCGDIRLNKNSEQLKSVPGTGLWILEKPFKNNQDKVIPLPVGFEPTLHKYRLPMPAQKKKPANIFVCSMADLFGRWVPSEWIKEVLEACAAAPWHNYMFLTKNPERYTKLAEEGILPEDKNLWWGTTTPTPETPFWYSQGHNTFVSIEPILAPFEAEGAKALRHTNWVIVGAQTGPGAKENRPKREWIQSIVDECRKEGIPLFMKDSVLEIWEDPLIRKYPAELQPKEVIIPHCRECEHVKETQQGNRGTRYDCDLTGKHIPGRYSRTSPPWCPKRKEG